MENIQSCHRLHLINSNFDLAPALRTFTAVQTNSTALSKSEAQSSRLLSFIAAN